MIFLLLQTDSENRHDAVIHKVNTFLIYRLVISLNSTRQFISEWTCALELISVKSTSQPERLYIFGVQRDHTYG
jgi:hypothetical protein